jgi:hypothetical protein
MGQRTPVSDIGERTHSPRGKFLKPRARARESLKQSRVYLPWQIVSPLAQQNRSRLEGGLRGYPDLTALRCLGRNSREQATAGRFETAEHVFLHPIGERASQQVATDAMWRLRPVERSPPNRHRNHPKVAALVYIAAFALDEGESCVSIEQALPQTSKAFKPDSNGNWWINEEQFAADFAADIPPEKAWNDLQGRGLS